VLAAAASDAPGQPGVYLFLDQADNVIYVGKATHLNSRLRQHAASRPPTSHLHQRYDLVQRVVWKVAKNEEAAAWLEADLIFALSPPFNANPGLQSRDPIGGVARPPFLVVTEVGDASLRFALEADSPAAGRVYGCFPHLGKGVGSRLGIACSDGYVALLRLLWAASGQGSHMPAAITRSAPGLFEVPVAVEFRPDLFRLCSGVGDRVVDALVDAAKGRPGFMQPALARDQQAARGFFAAGPRRLRTRRLRNGVKAGPVDAETYRTLVLTELTGDGDDPVH